MNDPVILALVFVGGVGRSAIRWLVGIGVGELGRGAAVLAGHVCVGSSKKHKV